MVVPFPGGPGGSASGEEANAEPPRYLTEPARMPCTKYRWKAKNTASGTSIEMNEPGPITLMFEENARICSRSAYVIGALSEVANTSATSRSFQTQRNWKMASDAIAGQPIGSTTRRNVDTS